MATYAERKRNLLEPLDDETRNGLQLLIEEARPYAEAYHKNVVQLMLILKKVESQYGDANIMRWSEALGISYSTAYRWRRVGNRFSAEFLTSHDIPFAKLRVISETYREQDIPHEVLEMALNPDVTALQLAGYIREVYSVSEQELDELKQEVRFQVGEFAQKAQLEDQETSELLELAEQQPKLALRLTSELKDAEDYHRWQAQQRSEESVATLAWVDRYKGVVERFSARLERELDQLKRAAKEGLLSPKLTNRLRDIRAMIEELESVRELELNDVPDDAETLELGQQDENF